MAELLTGTITLLFTDIEGSTLMLQALGQSYQSLLVDHHRLLRFAFQQHGGREISNEGDSFFVVFDRALDAAAAAVRAQQALNAHAWPEGMQVRVRMGLHTGEPTPMGSSYLGLDVHRAARISAAGHGGQILLSRSTRDALEQELTHGMSLRALGSHRLKDLIQPERLYQLVVPGLPADFPPVKSLALRPHNLRQQLTTLIGREQEVAAVKRFLQCDKVRLVTLTGPGGTGKTRLGLQVAVELLDQFADGVFFVTLASISDPGLVVGTVAQILGVREGPGQPLVRSLSEYLRDRQLLLVLDNFEHLLTASLLVADLLACCPRLKVLVTSRAVLHLQGEQEFLVPPLTLPDSIQHPSLEAVSHSAAVELFVQRAMAVRPEFKLTGENAPAVAEICRRLDGLPLAIELAAARIRLLTPRSMLSRLENRLSLLTGGARDLPERQQTLRGTIAWSYSLLDEAAQTLFRRVSVFMGGCSLEAAEAVCNGAGNSRIDVLNGLETLVGQSLLQKEEVLGDPRFAMLATIREFGLEQLRATGEAESLNRQHTAFFLAVAEEWGAHVFTADQVMWLGYLESDNDNIRSAMQWSLENDEVETVFRFADALWFFWILHSHVSEGWERLAPLLAHTGGCTPSESRAFVVGGVLAYFMGDGDRSAALLTRVLHVCRAGEGGRHAAIALFLLGVLSFFRKDFEQATAFWEEGLTLARGLKDAWVSAGTLALMGFAALEQGQTDSALSLCEESLRLARQTGERWTTIQSLRNLGLVLTAKARYSQAEACFREGLRLCREIDYQLGVSLNLDALAGVSIARGQPEAAAKLLGAAEAVRASIGVHVPPVYQATHAKIEEAARSGLEESVFAAAWAQGRSMR